MVFTAVPNYIFIYISLTIIFQWVLIILKKQGMHKIQQILQQVTIFKQNIFQLKLLIILILWLVKTEEDAALHSLYRAKRNVKRKETR